jgi:hypothetical protein
MTGPNTWSRNGRSQKRGTECWKSGSGKKLNVKITDSTQSTDERSNRNQDGETGKEGVEGHCQTRAAGTAREDRSIEGILTATYGKDRII